MEEADLKRIIEDAFKKHEGKKQRNELISFFLGQLIPIYFTIAIFFIVMGGDSWLSSEVAILIALGVALIGSFVLWVAIRPKRE